MPRVLLACIDDSGRSVAAQMLTQYYGSADPANQDVETVRRIVDDIDGRVRALLGRLGVVAQVPEATGRP